MVMFRKVLESLPFVHHQPPLTIPLRKALVMSLQRPVDLKQIEFYLEKHLKKDVAKTIDELKSGIQYLRKKIKQSKCFKSAA